MDAKIQDARGAVYALPTLLSWDVSHGFCDPCDSFAVTFLYSRDMLPALKAACRFTAVHAGETVFSGVVDEFELSAGETGCLCVLRGRGMQALLLDSEAESGEYFAADAAFVLDRHARPFGVTDVAVPRGGAVRASLTVQSGESHWSVVRRYCEFCLGTAPRFTPGGRLLLDGADSGRSFTVDGSTPLTAQRYGQDRYGVITAAIVKNRAAQTSVTVENERFAALGCRRVQVVNVPRKTGYDAMRHTGAWQIARSQRDFVRCRLTLPQCFAAFPGDTAVLRETPLGVSGTFTVFASRTYADGTGAGTVLDLREK